MEASSNEQVHAKRIVALKNVGPVSIKAATGRGLYDDECCVKYRLPCANCESLK